MRGAWAILALCSLLHTGSSLECLECFGLPYDCKETVRECYVHQTVCISKAYTYQDANGTRDQLVKGCSQGLSCNESTYVNMGGKAIYISNSCCSRNRCNQGTYYAKATLSQMRCFACANSSSSSCAAGVMNCTGVQDRCMAIRSVTTTTTAKGDTRTDSVVKGCGTGQLCGRRLDYSTGNSTTYSNVTCCSTRLCNTDIPTVTQDPTPNGLQCYACLETGKKECAAGNITQMNCTGEMTRCMDIVGFTRGNTLMRGCCSEKYCLGLSASLSVPVYQKLYCCAGNLCNTGDIASYYSTSSSWSLSAGVGATNVVWVLLFAATISWTF